MACRVLLTLIPVVAGIAAAIVAFYGSSVIAETPWLRNDTVLDVLKQAEGKGLTITVPESASRTTMCTCGISLSKEMWAAGFLGNGLRVCG